MDFNEYLIDISINEQTVHWCGHSDHQLEQPYLNYEQTVIEVSIDFLKSLSSKLSPEDIY